MNIVMGSKDEKFYRIVVSDVGIYSAVDRGDTAREGELRQKLEQWSF